MLYYWFTITTICLDIDDSDQIVPVTYILVCLCIYSKFDQVVFTAQGLASKLAYTYAFFLLRPSHSVLFDHCSTGHSRHLPRSFMHQSLSFWQIQISFPTLVLWFASSSVTYLLTYLLTYSMEQSPSWEANWFAASQKIPRIFWNLNVHYRIHNNSPTVPTLI